MSIVNGGGLANAFSAHACVSADGRWVVFESNASNLVTGDNNAATDIFVRDMNSNAVTRVNLTGANAEARGAAGAAGAISFNPSISGDGRFVTFESNATNLVSGDTNVATDVFVRDRDLDSDEIFDEGAVGETATRRLSVSTTGTQALGPGNATGYASRNHFMSGSNGSGRFVVFASAAANLVAGDANGKWDIFLRDRDTDNDAVYDEVGAVSTERVSLSDNGFEGNNDSVYCSSSTDGQVVSFTSAASNLVAGDLAAVTDCFVRDRAFGRTYRVSASKTWLESNGSSYHASLNGDGHLVGFWSTATNLVASDTNAGYDVFLRDLDGGLVPAPATGLAVTRNAASDPQHKLTLTWADNATNETGYEVWRFEYDEAGFHLLPSATNGYPTVAANIKTFADTGLTENHLYAYYVRAVNGVGASLPSDVAAENTWPTAPAAPTALALTVVSGSQIDLSWTDNATSEASFEIHRKLHSASSWPSAPFAVIPADSVSFSDEGLNQATQYDYRVRAINEAGASAFTSVAAAFTQLPAPSNLKVTAISSTQPKLDWTDNSGVENGFKIERYNAATSAFVEIAFVGANVVTFTDSGVSAETSPRYRVRAFTGTSATPTVLSSYSNEATVALLGAPSSLTASPVSTSRIDLHWTNNTSSAQGIKVERKQGAGAWTVIATLAPTTTAYANTGLAPSTQATYRVRAFASSSFSSYSNEATATTLPVAPTVPKDLKVQGTSSTTVLVTWTDNTTETSYKLERILAGGSWAVIATLAANSTSFVDTGRTPDRTYSYRLRAINAGGSSSNTAAQVVDMLKKPTNLAEVSKTATSVKMSWVNASALETGYEIWRKTGTGAYAKIATVGSATAVNYTDATAATGTTYTYKVRAYDLNSVSDFSNELTVTTP